MRRSLPHDLFEPLAARIAEVSGIRVPASKRWLLAARVADRMNAVGATDVEAYVNGVLDPAGAAELGQLVEAVRVGETRFFRHVGQLRAIRRVALPEIRSRHEREGDRAVRVWSAGCATGEEAYTLAMLLEDTFPSASGWRHEVLATDMSEPALERARAARYPAGSAHAVPPHIARWAIETREDEVSVTERAKRAVRFERRNLLDASYPRGFDLVLCRNVLIYFDRATQREVLERLASSVVPGGYLALGYAERLDRSDGTLLPIRTEDGVVYRRSLPDEDPVRPPVPARRAPAVRDDAIDADAIAREGARARDDDRDDDRGDGAASSSSPMPAARGRGSSPRSNATRRGAALEGSLEGPAGETTARELLARAVQSDRPVVDLRRLEYADERVARVLAQAAAAIEAQGRTLVVIADAPGTLRFLRRHNVAPPAEVRAIPAEEAT